MCASRARLDLNFCLKFRQGLIQFSTLQQIFSDRFVHSRKVRLLLQYSTEFRNRLILSLLYGEGIRHDLMSAVRVRSDRYNTLEGLSRVLLGVVCLSVEFVFPSFICMGPARR